MQSQLEGVPIFAGLNDAAIDLLVKHAWEVDAKGGEFILREGDKGNRFYVIVEGQVCVTKHIGTPEEVELARLGPRNFFGEMCILETLPRSASVVAVTDASLLSLSSFDFLRLYEQMPAQYGILVLNLARDLSRRLRSLDETFSARH